MHIAIQTNAVIRRQNGFMETGEAFVGALLAASIFINLKKMTVSLALKRHCHTTGRNLNELDG